MSEEQTKLVRRAQRCLKSLKYHEERLAKLVADASAGGAEEGDKIWEFLQDEVEQMSEAFLLEE